MPLRRDGGGDSRDRSERAKSGVGLLLLLVKRVGVSDAGCPPALLLLLRRQPHLGGGVDDRLCEDKIPVRKLEEREREERVHNLSTQLLKNRRLEKVLRVGQVAASARFQVPPLRIKHVLAETFLPQRGHTLFWPKNWAAA